MLSAVMGMCPMNTVQDQMGCQAHAHVLARHLNLQGKGMHANCPLGMALPLPTALPLPCLPNNTTHHTWLENVLLGTGYLELTPRSALIWKCKCRQALPCRTAELIKGERTEWSDSSDLWWSLGADFAMAAASSFSCLIVNSFSLKSD